MLISRPARPFLEKYFTLPILGANEPRLYLKPDIFSALTTNHAQKAPLFQLLVLLLIFIAAGILPAAASDVLKEAQIARELEQQLDSGEITRLKAGELEVLAIYEKNRLAETKGAAILLHGMASNPDAPQVIRPLRQRLPASGWSTLSLQIPIAPDNNLASYASLLNEVAPRIEAASKLFNDKNNLNQVIIAHDVGAAMALQYLASQSETKITALVCIEALDPGGSLLKNLEKLPLPVLDLYGSRGFYSEAATPQQRRIALQSNPQSRQIEVEGADHDFTGLNESLLIRVRSWLDKYAAGVEQQAADK